MRSSFVLALGFMAAASANQRSKNLAGVSVELNVTKLLVNSEKLFDVFLGLNTTDTKHCTDRGGCGCDCSWAKPDTCHTDDGSCCWACCCNAHPGPTPGPSPPGPTPGLPSYCPSKEDLTVAYGSPKIMDGGWQIKAGGAVATKSAFNLLGGSVEYDVDLSGVPTGVNANVYSISPHFNGNKTGFWQGMYCDGAKAGSGWCLEVDYIESNGNCGGATTLHTKAGPGNDGCTAWGCRSSYHYGGKDKFHMRIEHASDGTWTTIRDGQTISPSSLSPTPGSGDWSVVKSQIEQKGAVVYSSQWTGWVPVSDCGTSGNLDNAIYTVSNLKIVGKVLQGPTPTKC